MQSLMAACPLDHAISVAKLMSRVDTQASTNAEGSLSIRGTGQANGSFTSRSPSNNSASQTGTGPGSLNASSTRFGKCNSGGSSNAGGRLEGSSASSNHQRQRHWRGSGGASGASSESCADLKLGERSGSTSGKVCSSGTSSAKSSTTAKVNRDELGATKPRQSTARRRPRSPRYGPSSGSGSGDGGSSDGGEGGIAYADGSRGTEGETSGDIVTIHVCDESRGITRDFSCERGLLLREMKYFQSYLLGGPSPHEEIDILVHCDLHIFKWLFEYIRGDDDVSAGGQGNVERSFGVNDRTDAVGENRRPTLEVPLVVSILISSDFLQMRRLVDECLRFVGEHLTEIVKLPIDLSCLSDKLVLQLAKKVTLQQLAVAKDRKDKLLSRLHKKRLELDFRDRTSQSENNIHCCKYCANLFPEKVRHVMDCQSAPPAVSFRGTLVRRHEALIPWSLTRTVTSLHRRGMNWTAVYWFLWGLTQPLLCLECSEVFLAGDLGECRSHPEEAIFAGERGQGEKGATGAGEGSAGYYPCCRQPVYSVVSSAGPVELGRSNRWFEGMSPLGRRAEKARLSFTVEPYLKGCVSIDHTVSELNEDPEVLKVLRLQRHNVCSQAWRMAAEEGTQAHEPSGSSIGSSRNTSAVIPATQAESESTHPHSGGGGESLSGTKGAKDGSGGLYCDGLVETTAGSGKPGSNGSRVKGIHKRQSSAGRRPQKTGAANVSSATITTAAGTADKSSSASSNGDASTCGDSGSGGGVRVREAGDKGVRVRGVIGDSAEGAGNGRAETAALQVSHTAKAHERSTFVRIWESNTKEALSARERGLLPHEHPVQHCPEGFRVELDVARDSRMGEGQLRRWQTDTLRENDAHRMENLSENLRLKRRGGNTIAIMAAAAAVQGGGGGGGGDGGGGGGGGKVGGGSSKVLASDTKRVCAWVWGGGVSRFGGSDVETLALPRGSRQLSSAGESRRRGKVSTERP